MANMQVTFFEVPVKGKRVPFANQNGQRGVTSPATGITVDPASGYYSVSTQSGSVYTGPVSNMGNQTIAMDSMATPPPPTQNQYYPPHYPPPSYPPAREVKRRTTTIILALFLGGFGIHKIYLGATGIALFYIFFCWTLIPAIIAGFEVILYACMSDSEFDRRYNQP